MSVRPANTKISLGIRPVWSESSLSAWRNRGSLATHWAHSKESDQTGRMPRLICVFAWRTLILLLLSCRGSYLPHINHWTHTQRVAFEVDRNCQNLKHIRLNVIKRPFNFPDFQISMVRLEWASCYPSHRLIKSDEIYRNLTTNTNLS